MTLQQLAQSLWDQKILMVPAFPDKKPAVPYSHWRETYPTKEEYFGIWESWKELDEGHMLTGLGMIEIFDVDLKNDPTGRIVADFEAEIREYSPDLFARLYIEETPSGGRHYAYKREKVGPKRILAYAPDPTPLTFKEELDGIKKWKPVIEIQGANTLCRVWPTKGFKVIQGSILELPVLHENDVSLLEYIGREFDKKPPETVKAEVRKERIDGDTPGNDYANNVTTKDMVELFVKHGWEFKERGARVFLRRPGAKTKGYDGDIKNRIFMNFSSSVSEFSIGQGYGPFQVYTILEHGGDFKSAAKALAEKGYGVTHELIVGAQKPTNGVHVVPVENHVNSALWDKMVATRVQMSKPPKKRNHTFKWRCGNTEYGLASKGGFVLVSGIQKARKTSLVTSILASGVRKVEVNGFTLEIEEGEEIVLLDTEQSETDVFNTTRRILIQSLIREVPDWVHVYSIKDFDVKERLELISYVFEKHPNVAVLGIDGLVDIVDDFNDNREVKRTGDWLLRKAGNILLIGLMHVNRGKGEANGHLGAYFEKKCSAHLKVMLNDDDTSEVTFPDVRGGPRPPAFSFSVVGPNIPVVDGYPHPPYDFSIGNPDYHSQYFPKDKAEPLQLPRQEPDDEGWLTPQDIGLTQKEIDELYGK